jgi:phospholipid/cholesterol/gamma-HCH transport system substrate-binding protein
MELRYRREAAVGVFLIVAAALFVLGMIWLRGKSLRSHELVEISFSDVSGLKVGDPVRTSGVTVGQVKEIRLVAPGKVVVALGLNENRPPRRDARAMVRALDFFGGVYVDYDPGTAPEALGPSDVIPGQREANLGELAQSLSGPGRQALNNASNFLSPQNATELRAVLRDARVAVNRLGDATAAPSREVAAAFNSLREVMQRLDLILGGETTTETLEGMRDASRNLAQVTASLQHASATLDSILEKINTGQGSVGRMVNDTTLVADLHAASSALTALLTDLKANPGRYVHVSVF